MARRLQTNESWHGMTQTISISIVWDTNFNDFSIRVSNFWHQLQCCNQNWPGITSEMASWLHPTRLISIVWDTNLSEYPTSNTKIGQAFQKNSNPFKCQSSIVRHKFNIRVSHSWHQLQLQPSWPGVSDTNATLANWHHDSNEIKPLSSETLIMLIVILATDSFYNFNLSIRIAHFWHQL